MANVAIQTALIALVLQLFVLSSYCLGSPSPDERFATGWRNKQILETAQSPMSLYPSADYTSSPYCTQNHSIVKGQTCADIRAAYNVTQAQLQQLNPALNCKNLRKNQTLCVYGIPEDCQKSITVPAGPVFVNSPFSSCESIANTSKLTKKGFAILNPGIKCPEDILGGDLSWSETQIVCTAPGLGNIFVEYMGADGAANPMTFENITPIVQSFPDIVYRVVLAFAIDNDKKGKSKNGKFVPYWTPTLTPTAAKEFKAANPGAQILMSLGGATQFINQNPTVDVTWLDPSDRDVWVANAQASLTEIIDKYHIDGIDIRYEKFNYSIGPTFESSNFTYCMGTLIRQLKENNTIGLATIAPYENTVVEYVDLMADYGELIDYVHYQFYYSTVTTVDSYENLFNATAFQFVPWKLFASSEMQGHNTTVIAGSEFRDAIQEVWHERGLPGVMMWKAEDSLSTNFTDEKAILAILSAESQGNGSLAPAPSPGSNNAPPPGGVPSTPSPIGPGQLPTPNSAPAGLVVGRMWSFRQCFGLLTPTLLTVVVLGSLDFK